LLNFKAIRGARVEDSITLPCEPGTFTDTVHTGGITKANVVQEENTYGVIWEGKLLGASLVADEGVAMVGIKIKNIFNHQYTKSAQY